VVTLSPLAAQNMDILNLLTRGGGYNEFTMKRCSNLSTQTKLFNAVLPISDGI
jgi:hypothetical protein